MKGRTRSPKSLGRLVILRGRGGRGATHRGAVLRDSSDLLPTCHSGSPTAGLPTPWRPSLRCPPRPVSPRPFTGLAGPRLVHRSSRAEAWPRSRGPDDHAGTNRVALDARRRARAAGRGEPFRDARRRVGRVGAGIRYRAPDASHRSAAPAGATDRHPMPVRRRALVVAVPKNRREMRQALPPERRAVVLEPGRISPRLRLAARDVAPPCPCPRPPATSQAGRQLRGIVLGGAPQAEGMRWRTYERLTAELMDNEARLDRGFIESTDRLLTRLRRRE